MSLSRGLVLHMLLDQKHYNPATRRVTDLGGYANHGTAVDALSFTTDHMGQSNRAVDFDGINNRVDSPDSDSLNITGTASVCARMKSDVEDWGHIVFKGDAEYLNLVYDADGLVEFRVTIGGSIYSSGNGSKVTDGEWHYIIGTYDGSTIAIYVDGDLKNSAAASGAMNTNVNPFHIAPRSPSGAYKAHIEEVRVYNRALTDSEKIMAYEAYRQMRKV